MRRVPAGVVQGQRVSPVKLALAKQMRREMTPEERILWNELRRNRRGQLHFRRQQVIWGFIVDFYCDATRLAVELDGAFHDPYYDAPRDHVLGRIGVMVVRVGNCEVHENLPEVVERIARCARERIQTFVARRPNP